MLQGSPFDQARVQTGSMAISRTGPLFLLPTAGRGLRRIDPRTELPETLRMRRDTALAFEFNEQPFDLILDVEPAPARLRVESRTTINVEPRLARIDTRLDCRVSQGRTFEVRVTLPRGLEFLEAGPAEIIASAQVIPGEPRSGAARPIDSPRILALALNRQVKDPDSFTIQLKGSCPIDPSKPVEIPLFQPMADSAMGGRLAVVADGNLAVEVGETGDQASPFRVEWGPPAPDWEWPLGKRPGANAGLLRFRCDGNPESLPLLVKLRPRSIRHETATTATIDRAGAEVVEDVSFEVTHGSVSQIEIAMPANAPARWDIDGVDLDSREPLGQEADGSRRYRLKFANELADAFRFRIRYRLPFTEALSSTRPSQLKLGSIRVLEGVSNGQTVKLLVEAGLDVKAEGKGWSVLPVLESTATSDSIASVRLALSKTEDKAGPVEISVQAETMASLPRLVASRVWLRTLQRLDNDLATTAYFWIESRDGPITLELPAASQLLQARLGRPEPSPIEVEAAAADQYRLRLPASAPVGPILLMVDYLVPATRVTGRWVGPRLVGGLIQQTQWEVRLIGSRAGIGVPEGWTDENQWYWDGWIWRRRPWKSPAELSQWLTAGNTRSRITEALESEGQGGRHGYLFSRSGSPETLGFPIVSRTWLLVICSGPVLISGLLVLARRPPPRWLAGLALGIIFALAAFAEPNTALLVVQSSTLGFALFLASMTMNWALERRGGGRRSEVRPAIVSAGPTESPILAPPSPGSDDSTAIRARPGSSGASTADHIVLTRPSARGPGEATGTGVDLR